MVVSDEKDTVVLEMNDVHAGYGLVEAVSGISIRVKQGEIVALLGANGAGKSTTLRVVSGILPIRKGEMIFCGQPLSSRAPEKALESGIVYVAERGTLFHAMNVKDNLILGAYRRFGKEKREDIEESFNLVFELFPVLKERLKQFAFTLSGGEQQMLLLARGIMSRPKLLLLDEPSLGLAPLIVSLMMKKIGELRERGVSVLLAEQNAKAALSIAHRGYIVEVGRIVLEGSSEQLVHNEAVRAAYLGG